MRLTALPVVEIMCVYSNTLFVLYLQNMMQSSGFVQRLIQLTYDKPRNKSEYTVIDSSWLLAELELQVVWARSVIKQTSVPSSDQLYVSATIRMHTPSPSYGNTHAKSDLHVQQISISSSA